MVRGSDPVMPWGSFVLVPGCLEGRFFGRFRPTFLFKEQDSEGKHGQIDRI